MAFSETVTEDVTEDHRVSFTLHGNHGSSSTTTNGHGKSKFMINDILENADEEKAKAAAAAAVSSFFPAMTALALANIHNQPQEPPPTFYSSRFLQNFHHGTTNHNTNDTLQDDSSSIIDTKEDNCDNSLHGDQASSGK